MKFSNLVEPEAYGHFYLLPDQQVELAPKDLLYLQSGRDRPRVV